VALAYIDSSCVVAVALGEPGGRRIDRLTRRFDRLVSSALLEAEVRAALARERVTPPSGLLDNLDWILPDRALSPEIERVAAAGVLRGADLWHVACALYLDPGAADLTFLTLDVQQRGVAAVVGFMSPR
jgi:hypothetical protein